MKSRKIESLINKVISSDKQQWNSEIEVAEFLLAFANTVQAESFLEYGTYKGLVSLYLLSAKSLVRLVTVDVEKKSEEFFSQLPKEYRTKLQFIHSDTATISQHVSPTTRKFDVIYIDADHSFQRVLEDVNSALHYSKRGTYIFLHDARNSNFEVRLVVTLLKRLGIFSFNRFFSIVTMPTPRGDGLAIIEVNYINNTIVALCSGFFRLARLFY